MNRRKFLFLSLSTFLIGTIVDGLQRKVSEGRLNKNKVVPLEYGPGDRGIVHLPPGTNNVAIGSDFSLDEHNLFAEDPISEHSTPTTIYVSGS